MKRFSVGALALSALVTVLLATACGGEDPVHTPTIQAGATVSSSRKQVATPAFDPVAGTYSSAVSVTLSDATNGVAIYYTTDHTTPSKASTLYTGPITVSSTTTIEAVAMKNGFSDSAIASATYVISSTSPTTYTVGGSIAGLSGTVVLQDNGGDNLTATADGTFTFATPLADGSGYSVTVSTQPPGQTCTVANGSGTIADANVTNVAVSCTDALCIDCMAQECPWGYVCPLDGPACCVSHCGDGVRNGDEGDVDCGGSCVDQGFPRCVSGQHCWTNWDCASGFCLPGDVCQ